MLHHAKVARIGLALTIVLAAALAGFGAGGVYAQSGELFLPRIEAASNSGVSMAGMLVENLGQFDSSIRFQMTGGSAALYVLEDGLWLSSSHGQEEGGGAGVKLTFPGAAARPHLVPFDRLETTVSYLYGAKPDDWVSDVPVWGGLRFQDLYPGIDLELHAGSGGWSWRFVGQPAADAAPLRLRIEGAQRITPIPPTAPQADAAVLQLATPAGAIRFALPGGNLPLRVEGVLSGGETVTLDYPTDFSAPPLIATPGPIRAAFAPPNNPEELLYATYLGGAYNDIDPFKGILVLPDEVGYAIALDGSGATYITGYTNAPDFPSTTGAADPGCGADGNCDSQRTDVFVAKLSPDGSKVVYATFLGGSENDSGLAIAVDGQGRAYVTGLTESADFPIAGNTAQAHAGATESFNSRGFVAKLSADGTRFDYSITLGSTGTEGRAIAVDGIGTAYVSGMTSDEGFSTTAGAFAESFSGGLDAFVVKLASDGETLYATFMGGSAADVGNAIALNADGAVFIAGWTTSSDFPTTEGAFDRARAGPDSNWPIDWDRDAPLHVSTDAFVAKLNADGTKLVYGTYLGGDHGDRANGIAVDKEGAVYVTGSTQSAGFPTTQGAFDRAFGGGTCNYVVILGKIVDEFPCRNVFVTKLNAGGTGLVYSTFLGGAQPQYLEERGRAIAVDTGGAAYVTGWTTSPDFPTTEGAFQRECTGEFNAGGSVGNVFVTKVAPAGNKLAHSTCLSSVSDERGYGIAVDGAGAAYVTGHADYYFPATEGAYDTSPNGGYDPFVIKLGMVATEPPDTPGPPTPPPGPQPKIDPDRPPQPNMLAYIYDNDTNSRHSFEALMAGNGFTVDPIALDEVNGHNFAPYCAILVGSDAEAWPAISASWANAYQRPFIGIGLGGYRLFQTLGLDLGAAGQLGSEWGADQIIVDTLMYPTCEDVPDLAIYHHPNAFAASAAVQLYLSVAAAQHQLSFKHSDLAANAGVVPIATQNADLSCLNVHKATSFALEKNRYLIWGYGGAPSGMTQEGKDFFVNAVYLFSDCRPEAVQPTVEQVTARGMATQNGIAETGKPVLLRALLEMPAGFTLDRCTWVGVPPPVDEFKEAAACTYEYVPHTGPGPAFATYGEKHVTLYASYRNDITGVRGEATKDLVYKVYFARDGDDNGNSRPNWFEYWGDDGAVPQLRRADVSYQVTLGADTYGHFLEATDRIELGPAAAKLFNTVTIVPTARCPGATWVSTQGIDTATETLEHEIGHKWVYHNWDAGGAWAGRPDSDDPTPGNKRNRPADNLPDFFEISVSRTHTGTIDSCNLGGKIHADYSQYGDEEFYVQQQAAGKRGIVANDWANPGKQAGESAVVATERSEREAASVGGGPWPAGELAARSDEVQIAGMADLTGAYGLEIKDTDSDGHFDSLRLSAGLSIAKAALYNVVAWLEDRDGASVVWAASQNELEAGEQMVDLDFDTSLIHQAGADGPFTVARIEVRVGYRELLAAVANDVMSGLALEHSDFDPPDAALTGGFSDQGIDVDEDGLYDILRVPVEVAIHSSGTYTLLGELHGSGPIGVTRVVRSLAPGTHTLNLDFDGQSIFNARMDGPYTLRAVRLLDADGIQRDFRLDAHTSGAYAHTAFEQGSTFIEQDSLSDQGVDDDGDGLFDSVRLKIRISCDQASTYRLTADLHDSTGALIGSVDKKVELTAGSAVQTLDFAGASIAENAKGGPYGVEALALLDEQGRLVDYLPVAHTTRAYGLADFVAGAHSVYLPAISR